MVNSDLLPPGNPRQHWVSENATQFNVFLSWNYKICAVVYARATRFERAKVQKFGVRSTRGAKGFQQIFLALLWVRCLVVRWFFRIRGAWCLLGTAAACGGARTWTAAARCVDGWRRGGGLGRVVGRCVNLLCPGNPRKHWETKKKPIFLVRMFGK